MMLAQKWLCVHVFWALSCLLSDAFVPGQRRSTVLSQRTLERPSRFHRPGGSLLENTFGGEMEIEKDTKQQKLPFSDREMTVLTHIADPVPVTEEQFRQDEEYMLSAILEAETAGGERGVASAFPKPTVGAVLVADDGRILGKARSDFRNDAVRAAIAQAGLEVTPLSEWCVSWPSSEQLRKDLETSTLYVTLEPSSEREGTALPPITQLIELVGIPRVVIGCADPIQERHSKGAAALHSAGIEVRMGSVLEEECENLIVAYAQLANSKLHKMARTHFNLFGRPLGFLHCSVVDSDNIEAFARQGNAFGTKFGGQNLSFRKFGAYEIAPPPEVIWADDGDDDDFDDEEFLSVEFEDEDFQGDMSGTPMMPWYEQADAVVATFPKQGNGPSDDGSLAARLSGLKWLATHGCDLPAGVERIVVMDATDLKELPLKNGGPDLPNHVDIEKFWRANHRKPTRVLLRRGNEAQARAAADAAAAAAKAAAEAAAAAAAAIETGDAAKAAEAAIQWQKNAEESTKQIQDELLKSQALKRNLEEMGVIVELLDGSEPIDVMKHLGERSGLHTIVWRAGCWGERGVQSILAGAFQWVSAHLAVDAVGGKFWQLMLAENAVRLQ
jgi:pyrimidine deaminase RibD-like protein